MTLIRFSSLSHLQKVNTNEQSSNRHEHQDAQNKKRQIHVPLVPRACRFRRRRRDPSKPAPLASLVNMIGHDDRRAFLAAVAEVHGRIWLGAHRADFIGFEKRKLGGSRLLDLLDTRGADQLDAAVCFWTHLPSSLRGERRDRVPDFTTGHPLDQKISKVDFGGVADGAGSADAELFGGGVGDCGGVIHLLAFDIRSSRLYSKALFQRLSQVFPLAIVVRLQ